MKKILTLILPCLFLSLHSFAQKKNKNYVYIDPDNSKIKYTGRIDFSNPKAPRFAWSGISIKAAFEGSHCQVILHDFGFGADNEGQPDGNYYNLIIDNKIVKVMRCNKEGNQIYDVGSLSDSFHTIEIFKRTEASVGESEFRGFILAKGKKLVDLPANPTQRKMEFIGNSITCGYGNEGNDQYCNFSPKTENNYMAYGAITARNLNAEYVAVPFSGKGLIRNYDQSTKETMPELYDRIFASNPDKKWDFKRYMPDIVVINLGTNDFAKSIPDSAMFVNAYINFIGRIRSNYPNARIICITGPMMSDNLQNGSKALTTINNYIQGVIGVVSSKGDSRIYTLALSSQGSLGFGCDWHPNIAQHKKNASELTDFIKEKMGW